MENTGSDGGAGGVGSSLISDMDSSVPPGK